MTQRKAHLSWEVFMDLVKKLAEKLEKNCKIFGIPRNGSIIAQIISHQRPDITFFTDLNTQYAYHDVIIIDDILDSGATLKPYIEKGYRVATLFTRGKVDNVITAHVMDTDHWIVFPFEKE